MKSASCKAKGRRLQQWVARQIARVTGRPIGKDAEIECREMGQAGTDVRLYGEAAELYPFSVECKNTERLEFWAAVDQAAKNKKAGTDWQVFVKRNRSAEIVVMDAAAWFDFWEQYREATK